MSMRSTSRAIRSFQSRLNIVAAQRATHDEGVTEVSVLPDWKAHFRVPLAIAGAFCVGLLAVLAARTFRGDMVGGTFVGENPDTSMLMDGGLALLAATVMCVLLRYRHLFCMVGTAAGVVLALIISHNLAHYSPMISNMVYGDDWTEELVAASEPGSVYFRGSYVTVLQPASEEIVENEDEDGESEEKELPRVIRLQ